MKMLLELSHQSLGDGNGEELVELMPHGHADAGRQEMQGRYERYLVEFSDRGTDGERE